MADILEFGKKADSLRSERDLTVRRLKIESLRKFFQCSRCVMKCSKCGVQIESQEYDKFAVPYSFCKPCMQEYQ
jgi:Pyruvate/2-oxoacid:ferredoxin oxidoreductase delta subunit